ncbi:MAG: acyl carrier protein [Peptoniphilus sp.]|nr:acyl carrier protein [Peptoniphilus sp.]MDD7363869.1 acyl carrier protein [Bacillota bacterium]MDY6044292.1 acyl carrier protein [Peptoniphilus sp.]
MRDRILQIISEQVNRDVEDLDPKMNFVDDLNMDSIELVELIMSIEDEFEIELDEDKLEDLHTIGDVLELAEEYDQ